MKRRDFLKKAAILPVLVVAPDVLGRIIPDVSYPTGKAKNPVNSLKTASLFTTSNTIGPGPTITEVRKCPTLPEDDIYPIVNIADGDGGYLALMHKDAARQIKDEMPGFKPVSSYGKIKLKDYETSYIGNIVNGKLAGVTKIG